MNGKEFGEKDIEELISTETNRIYGNQEIKEKFDQLKKEFKTNLKAIEFLEKFPFLIPKLADYKKFFNDIFITFLESDLKQVQNKKEEIISNQANIKEIMKEQNFEENKFTEIWNKFAYRFKSKKFDLRIDNEFNAVIGQEVPVFSKYIPGTEKKVDNPKEYRFSTAEIKIFNLINFIMTVESMLLNEEKFVIILDDAVDSFDYKNKYGIVDYIEEIKNKEQVQIIIFTHNFDFYRSCVIALGNETGQYFAYKNDKNEITFYDVAKNKYLLNINHFNSWKDNPSIYKFFAFIPFSRTVLQLSDNSKNEHVQTIDKYIHYSADLEKQNSEKIISVLERNMSMQAITCIQKDELFLYKLSASVEQIIKGDIKIKETDLELKITLGLYIRIFLERFLFLNYSDNKKEAPKIISKTKQTKELIKLNQQNNFISTDDLSCCSAANIISPAYIHINGFMYEPLIDVGLEELIDSAKWIFEKNQKWALMKE